MKTSNKEQKYVERKRQAILNLGYGYIKLRSKAKKSLRALKQTILNNTGHLEGAKE